MKNCLKMLLILLVLTVSTLQDNCIKGCLSCNVATQNCVFCDSTQGFFLTNGACTYLEKQNCAIVRQDGQGCYMCQRGFVIQNNECVQAADTSSIRCNASLSQSLCNQGLLGFPAFDFIVISQKQKILNCAVQTRSTICDVCESGYIIGAQGTQCVSQQELPQSNCFQVSSQKCVQCGSQYIVYPSYYIPNINNSLYQGGNTNLDSASQILYNLNNNIQKIATGYCLEDSSKIFCQTYNNQGICSQCKPGYYLSADKNCLKYMYNSISNCGQYDGQGKCSQCNAQYYLGIDLQCYVVSSPISNCLYYHYGTSYNTIQCVQCTSAYYLNSGACTIRTNNNIANCLQYNISADNCAQCNTNYDFYQSTYTVCYLTTTNCAAYSQSGSTMTCTQCNNFYYLNSNNQCVQIQTPANCMILNSSSQCTKCSGAYYLTGSSCTQSPAYLNQTNCSTLNSSDAQSCQSCASQYSSFQIQSVCALIPSNQQIVGCSSYNSSNVCTACQSLFYLNGSNQCMPQTYNTALKCYTNGNNNTCVQCLPNYTLVSSNCVHQDETIEYNCQSINQSSSPFYCAQCGRDYIHTNINKYRAFCQLQILSPYSSSAFNTCLVFNGDDSLCVQCPATQVINTVTNRSSAQCISQSSCSSSIILNIINQQQSILYPQQKSVCQDTSANNFTAASGYSYTNFSSQLVTNCQYYGVVYNQSAAANASITYVCTQCKANYVPVFDSTNDSYRAHIYDQGNISTDHQNRQYSISSCVLFTTVQTSAQNYGVSTQNCSVFIKETQSSPLNSVNDLYGCHKCAFGFSGVPVQRETIYYIAQCIGITSCNTNVYYQGFGALQNQLAVSSSSTQFPLYPMSNYLTCHKCSSKNQIPFFATNFASVSVNSSSVPANTLVSYTIQNIQGTMNQSVTSTLSDPVTQCIDLKKIQSLDQANQFPINCAAGILLADRKFSIFNGNQSSIMCSACQPMYFPSFFTAAELNNNGQNQNNIPFAIKSCNYIQNCSSSNRFNGCDKCIDGYSLQWNSSKQQPDYTQCVKSIKNCLYTNANSSCAVCHKGFVLFADGICQDAKLNSCDPDQISLFINFNATSSILIDFTLFIFQNGYNECLQCDSIYYKIQKISNSSQACMKDLRIESSQQKSRMGYYIQNCSNYVSSQNSLTYSSSNPQVLCQWCSNGYILNQAQTICVPQWILSNCYVPASYSVCTTCNEGFYLSNGQCVQGSIQNCKTYTNSTTCSQCYSDYFLNSNKCLYVSGMSCTSITNSSGVLSCSSCRYNQYNVSNVGKNICALTGFNLTGCAIVDQSGNCAICKANYYMSQIALLCILWQNNDANCQAFNFYLDQCQICKAGFMYDAKNKICISAQYGLQNCTEYDSNNQCIACKAYFAPILGQCVLVTVSQWIDNCLFYSKDSTISNKKCSLCEENFILQNNQCIQTSLINCVLVDQDFNCSKCAPGYYLQQTALNTVCVANLVPNCQIQDPKNNCLVCSFGYYLQNDGICYILQNVIQGCLYQQDQSTCYQCQEGYQLSANKTECLYMTPNQISLVQGCSFIINLSQEICSVCEQGYFLTAQNTCQMCLINNCAFCNPKLPTVCIACRSGFHMNTQGNCIANDDSVAEILKTITDYTQSGLSNLLSLIVAPLLLNML